MTEEQAPSYWTIDSPQIIDIDDVRALRVSIVGGRLDVITHEEPTTRIEVADITGTPLNVSFHGGTLTVEHHDQNPMSWLKRIGSFGHQHIVLSIAVPAGTPVRASTVSGEGLISGTSGNSELKTVSGSVMADGTSGLLTTDTVSGEIIVRDHRGPFVAKSVGGEITASGELLNVRAKTISGDLSFDFQGSPNDLAMSSVSGDVTVRLPAEVGVALNVKSVSGRIIVDDQKYSGTNQRVETITGAEDRQLRLNGNSVSGNISIIHQVPAR